MEHIYHRGKYRSGEWCKHLRPFLKRVGNKRWRRDGIDEIEKELSEDGPLMPYRKKRKKKKLIKVKFTLTNRRGIKTSYCSYYETQKQVNDAIRRNAIERIIVYDKDGKMTKEYEKRNTQ